MGGKPTKGYLKIIWQIESTRYVTLSDMDLLLQVSF
jgi:hypothetical protein